jgi:hypothetical protein
MTVLLHLSTQGDRHASQEILLATPLLLVSTVCLYNWKGLPNKTTMLNQLAVLENAAQHVQFR